MNLVKIKKAQLQSMPFQMIFSLILVAVVIFVGFFVIKMFLDRAEQIKFLDFQAKFGEKVISVWKGDTGSRETINLPLSTKLDLVCFVNKNNCINPVGYPGFCQEITNFRGEQDMNMFFYPLGVAEKFKARSGFRVSCENPGSIVKECLEIPEQVFCFPVIDGSVRIVLLKDKQGIVKLSSQ